MLKHFLLAAAATIVVSPALAQDPMDGSSNDLTADEAAQAQQISVRVTSCLEAHGDIGTVIDDFFVDDFMMRYLENQRELAKSRDSPTELYFAPGLVYSPELLTEISPDDWKRFYVTVHNFLLRGVVVVLNRSAPALLKGDDPSDAITKNMYPRDVVKLFDADPILRNFIQAKGRSRPIKTAQEMQRVIATVEQGLAIIDGPKESARYSLTDDSKKVIELLQHAGPLRQYVHIADATSFGYPVGTRFIHIVNP